MAAHNILGKEGEEKAADYLVRQGYSLRNRNWRSGKKELDIIAEKDGEIIVVEVKTRKNTDYENPQDAVNEKKIRRIVAATDAYLRKNELDLPVRFDIITIVGSPEHFAIEHIKEAFYPPVW